MKQVELAQQLGISKSYLSMILSGKRKGSPEIVERIRSLKSVNFRHNILLAKEEVVSSNLIFRSSLLKPAIFAAPSAVRKLVS